MINVGNLLVKRNKVRIALGIQAFSVGEFKFEVMALSPSLIETLECHETHDDMLCYAADNGLVINNELMSENEELSERLAEFWAENEESELRQAVGKEVCELSGLAAYMNELLETEEDAKEQARITAEVDEEIAKAQGDQVVCGDSLTPEQLHADADSFTANQ